MLLAETLAVSEDEPCFMLAELNFQSPGSRGWRRYQHLVVVRDEKLADARIDLGPAKEHTAPGFRIPGGVHDEKSGRIEILHTVGELRDIADFQRGGLMWQPEVQPADLVVGYHEHLDQSRKWAKRESVFGALGKVQRD